MRRRASTLGFALTALLLLAGCAPDPTRRLTDDEKVERAQGLVVQGVGHAEIDEWPQAIERFTEAAEFAPGEALVAFNLAVAHFRNAEFETARSWLDRVPDSAPVELRARSEYLRGKLALEAGDFEGEEQAYRRAAEIDPTEPAYPYSLSQVSARLNRTGENQVGDWLEHASDLWPKNARLAAELAQWRLGQKEPAAWRQALAALEGLAGADAAILSLVERGRSEMDTSAMRSPVSLRRALNLLRPGKRFQTDSAALDAHLEVLPLPASLSERLVRRSRPAVASVTFEIAQLLPAAPFGDDETVVEVITSNDALDRNQGSLGGREADLTILTDVALWFLGRDGDSYERLTGFAKGTRRILVGELDGDGSVEIVLVGPESIELWGRSADRAWSRRDLPAELAGAGALRAPLLLDFEHDGDLDILAIDGDGRPVLATNRGEAGLGPFEPAPLPVIGTVKRILTTDLDNDADQDLVLASDDMLHVFINWRQGEYVENATFSLPGPFEELLAADADGDGRFDLLGVAAGRLRFWRNRSVTGLERAEEVERNAADLLGNRSIETLAATDLDLDGDLDFVVTSSNAERAVSLHSLLQTDADAFGSGPSVEAVAMGAPAAGVLALDLDGDHDPDLLSWGPSGWVTARATGAGDQGWIYLTLRGLAGKVPLDGRGARLDVSFGLDTRSFELERPEAIVGRGGRAPSLVKVTWPNGISEFLFEPEPDAMHQIRQELRIEGSCPFLYASDGDRMHFVTDILGMAPLGMLAAPGAYVPADPEEYLRLPDWVATEGSVELRITEELREVAYLDQTELVVVDAPPGVEVYNGERWIEGRIEGLDLRLLGPLTEPTFVRDHRGREVTEVVATLDHRYLTNHEGVRLYQGAVPPHRLEIGIPPAIAASGRAALVLTGWLHWGNTSMNVARAQDPFGAPVFPFLEIPAPNGGWKRVELDVGLPAGKTKPVVVDLSGLLDLGDPRVRVTTDFEVYWDRIAVAQALPSDSSHQIARLAPTVAELTYGGFSRWYRPAENGPYLFDYSDRRPYPWRTGAGERPISWQEHEGYYTPFGDVTTLLTEIDDRMAIFGSGEELALSFDTGELPDPPEGWSRTLFLHSEGWEKDGDPNVACSQTVGPLPWRAMTAYPCPPSGLVESSETAGLEPPAARSGRWVDRHRLERRVQAWGG